MFWTYWPRRRFFPDRALGAVLTVLHHSRPRHAVAHTAAARVGMLVQALVSERRQEEPASR